MSTFAPPYSHISIGGRRYALSIDGDFTTAKNNLGVVLKDLGKNEEALELFLQTDDDDVNVANAANVLRDQNLISDAFTLVCSHLFSEEECAKENLGLHLDTIVLVTALALLEKRPRHVDKVSSEIREKIDNVLLSGCYNSGDSDGQCNSNSNGDNHNHNRLGLISSLSVFMNWLNLWDNSFVTSLYTQVAHLEFDENASVGYVRCRDSKMG